MRDTGYPGCEGGYGRRVKPTPPLETRQQIESEIAQLVWDLEQGGFLELVADRSPRGQALAEKLQALLKVRHGQS